MTYDPLFVRYREMLEMQTQNRDYGHIRELHN